MCTQLPFLLTQLQANPLHTTQERANKRQNKKLGLCSINMLFPFQVSIYRQHAAVLDGSMPIVV